MLRHKLRTLILRNLDEQPRSGYGLIKTIAAQTGWKPSYGSMYPTLDKMREEGLLTVKQEGRKKRYSLTTRGREQTRALGTHHAEMVAKARESLKLMSHLLGIDSKEHNELVDLFLSAIERGETPFKEVMQSSTKMKVAFWQLYKQNLIKKHKKEINSIINEATQKLRALE